MSGGAERLIKVAFPFSRCLPEQMEALLFCYGKAFLSVGRSSKAKHFAIVLLPRAAREPLGTSVQYLLVNVASPAQKDSEALAYAFPELFRYHLSFHLASLNDSISKSAIITHPLTF